jgi:tetratricopeptide (TPR) repeat protein
MSQDEAGELVAKGAEALARDQVYLALVCFERAIRLERTPLICSSLAYCLAKGRGQYREAIELGREAISREPAEPVHYYNLGRVHILAQDRKEAIAVLRQGLQLKMAPEILRELDALGARKPPVFPKLPRSHPLNKLFGRLLSRLGLR